MPTKRPEWDLSIERVVLVGPGAEPATIRFTARFAEGTDVPDPTEVASTIRTLIDQMVRALPPDLPSAPALPRPERGIQELLETYRPRQPELVDLLRDEGQLSAGEYAQLKRHLSATPTPALPAGSAPHAGDSGEPPLVERPLAAAPLAHDRTPATPRPVAQLLELYRIESVKQAGAVRARRQISYDEYMAIKAHFAPAEAKKPQTGG